MSLSKLHDVIASYKRLAVAFSGGVDSSLLLKVAVEVLGKENVLALTAKASTFPEQEFNEAQAFIKRLGVRHVFFESDELELEDFVSNPPDRCYHCKKALFSKILSLAHEHSFTHLADGTNTDDLQDYRPGHKALKELGVSSPLKDAGLSKQDIREISQQLGLATWNKPSLACLATRIPYGEIINNEKLRMIEKAELLLAQHGFRQFRVRHHQGMDKNYLARIELNKEEMPRLFSQELMSSIDIDFKKLGYAAVSLDLSGYSSGNMNNFIK